MKKKIKICILCLILILSFPLVIYAESFDDVEKWGKNFEEKGRDWGYLFANFTVPEANEYFQIPDSNLYIEEPMGKASDSKMFTSLSGEYVIMRVKTKNGSYIMTCWDKNKHCIDLWSR